MLHKSEMIDYVKQACGPRLRDLREGRGVSQLDLELQAGLSVGTISRIENNRSNPSKETLLKIAVTLGLGAMEVLHLFGVDIICSDSLLDTNAAVHNTPMVYTG